MVNGEKLVERNQLMDELALFECDEITITNSSKTARAPFSPFSNALFISSPLRIQLIYLQNKSSIILGLINMKN